MGNLDDPRMPYDYSKREYGTLPPDERKTFRWVSEIAYKNVHRIVARGYDTTELMEEGYGVVDMLFIDFQARIPLIEEEKMLNYIMILGLEDGLSLPAVVARTVAQSKTFLTQACCASILAFGHAYGAYSAFGNMLEEYLGEADKESEVIAQAAEEMVKENLDNEALGVSGLMLKDPAAKRLIARAEKLGVAGTWRQPEPLPVEHIILKRSNGKNTPGWAKPSAPKRTMMVRLNAPCPPWKTATTLPSRLKPIPPKNGRRPSPRGRKCTARVTALSKKLKTPARKPVSTKQVNSCNREA